MSSTTDRVLSLVQLAAVAAIAYVAWQAYRKIADRGGKAIDAVQESIGDVVMNLTGQLPPPVVDAMNTNTMYWPVIDGTPCLAYYSASLKRWAFKSYDWNTHKYADAPLGWRLPQGWAAAPQAVMGFQQLKDQGQPWYTPWDTGARGLDAPLVKAADVDTTWMSQIFSGGA